MREIRATHQQVPRERRSAATAPCPIPVCRLAQAGRRARRSIPAPSAWAAATCSPKGSSARSRTCCRTAQAEEVLLPLDRLRARQARSRRSRRCYQQSDRSTAYPQVKDLAVHGSENPNLMPKDSITVRFHSVGGWGAITTGKNLAMTLFDLLGYHIKANPKYGSEKKGQPTTYYLSAAPEPIRINCEYFYVDVVLSPDPERVPATRTRWPACKKGGVFIIQSDLDDARGGLAARSRAAFQKIIVDNEHPGLLPRRLQDRARRSQRPRTAVPHAGHRLPGRVLRRVAGDGSRPISTEETAVPRHRDQLQHKFGAKGARVVEDNVRVVRRGFDEVNGDHATKSSATVRPRSRCARTPACRSCSSSSPRATTPTTDIHRFWEQTGNFYVTRQGQRQPHRPVHRPRASCRPSTGVFRDMTGIRFDHPGVDPARTAPAAASCWTVCPDTRHPGLGQHVGDVARHRRPSASKNAARR